MKQLTTYAVALSVSLIFAGTAASAEQTVIPNGSRPSKTASSSQFTGNVRHEPVFPATEEAPFPSLTSPLNREPVPSGTPIPLGSGSL